ncbi:MAG: RNA-binding S4 domain-containing protein [Leptolyngbyaceae cyanobacterium SM2_3_12]|nr:RNA-binding S4 domain-containing protein [Leptolyngbyaceae cyanobacterium SM2_3_12]
MSSVHYIKLDQFLKQMRVVSTGGQAKFMIIDGEVKVNGEVETRRGRKLMTGDQVEVNGQMLPVDLTQPW